MDGGVDRVDFGRCGDVEARLLEAETHAASACEQIDTDGVHGWKK